MARENSKSDIKNEFLPGAVEGGKVQTVATIAMVKQIESQWGISLLVKFVTESGHSLTTFYSGDSQEFNPGAKVTVKGTVKRLDDSKYGKTVLLTRVKVAKA